MKDCSILVTEDDPSLRALIKTALRRRAVEIAEAENGEDAIRFLREARWDVLVLDLMMPVVSGFDVIDWLAAHPARKPSMVMVVSAMDRGVLHRLDPSVVNAIMFKPFDVAFLAAYVRTACDLRDRDRRHSRIVGEKESPVRSFDP